MVKRTFAKLLVFLAFLYTTMTAVGQVMAPIWTSWNNNNTFTGLYKIPENTIQIACVGTSCMTNGISPMELYGNFGYCVYDIGSERQPLLCSYYLMKEVYRRNPKTLKAVILDTSYIVESEDDVKELEPFVEKCMIRLQNSALKLEAALELRKIYPDFDALAFLFPVLKYHTRWTELDADDFDYHNQYYSMGQNLEISSAAGLGRAPLMPADDIMEEGINSEETIAASVGKQAAEYLPKFREFCDEHGISLILIKTPKTWNNLKHFASKYVADSLGVPFIDFNDRTFLEEIHLNPAIHMTDMNHCNVFGAQKISNYLGEYLKKNYDIPDIRGDSRYEFMEEYLAGYDQTLKDAMLTRKKELSDFLSVFQNERYFVVISAYDDAAGGLTEEIRAQMAELGLKNLSEIQEGESYLGIMDGGKVVLDMGSHEKTQGFQALGTYEKGEIRLFRTETLEKQEEAETLNWSKGFFRVLSRGKYAGNAASININGWTYSNVKTGLNIVIMRKDTETIVSKVCFDTSRGVTRTLVSEQGLAEYNKKYKKKFGTIIE